MFAGPAAAAELGGGWTVDLVAAAALQCPFAAPEGADLRCGAAAPVQPELRFSPAAAHGLGVRLGFAAGNGLEGDSPFVIPLWAADLEDGVRDINGGRRDFLLTAWYRFAADLGDDDRLRLTAGIIDGTDFLDGNAFANDEYTQFMNGALVNGPNGFVPSYEPGAAVRWDTGAWSLRAVYMRAGAGETGGRHHYFGGEAGLALHNRFGQGNVRLVLQGTSSDFAAADGPGRAALRSWVLSVDQELGDRLGLWARFGFQDAEAAILFRSLYSGGLSLHGRTWNRARDQLGIGLAVLPGGNLDVDDAHVFELYYRAELNPRLAATLDLQHVRQSLREGTSDSAWVAGLRLVLVY